MKMYVPMAFLQASHPPEDPNSNRQPLCTKIMKQTATKGKDNIDMIPLISC
jgi:hypothetical protein